MKKLSLLLLTLTLGLGAACAGDNASGPDASVATQPRDASFTRLEVTPSEVVLLPDSAVQLKIKAWDQLGRNMVDSMTGDLQAANRTVYMSSDTRIADVSSRGVVKGIAPGSADITATLTLGGITHTASAHTVVSGARAVVSGSGFPAGDYDLTMRITMFDPVWGDLTGYSYTAVLEYPDNGIGGTWENFRLFDANGQPSGWVTGGVIRTYTDFAGRIVNELASSNFHVVLVAPLLDAHDSTLVTGTWGCCGHIAGTFTARRRQ